jgi:hypothetical protein
MTAASTVSYDGMTYGLDEMGQVKWATYTPQEERPEIPPECWQTQAFDAERAHAATLAACRGQH